MPQTSWSQRSSKRLSILACSLEESLARSHTSRISGHRYARCDVPRDDTAGADHGSVTDGHAWQEDGAAADPDVAADPDRAAEFEPGAPRFRITRMVGSVDLHRGPDLGAVAD